MNRRPSLGTLSTAGAAALLTSKAGAASHGEAASDRLGQRLPMRPFGRSGEMVTRLGVGGFHIGICLLYTSDAADEVSPV